jgi:maleylpyruvate isomerase
MPMAANDDPLYLDNCVEGAARGHQRLLALLDEVLATDDPEAWFSSPSALPDWTRRHVVAHLARNAESHVHLFAEAEAGREGEQYPGGGAARAAGIESYVGLDAATLVARNRAAVYALESAWAHTSAAAWDGAGRNSAGVRMKTRDLPMLRWREVEVHTSDLDAGVTFHDWNPIYVRYDLPRMTMMQTSRTPMGMSNLPEAAMRLSESERLAWLLGRHTPAGLEPLQGF